MYGQRGQGNIAVRALYGPHDHRLLFCKTCKRRFSERKGTPLFDCRLDEAVARSVLAHLREGCGVRQPALRTRELHPALSTTPCSAPFSNNSAWVSTFRLTSQQNPPSRSSSAHPPLLDQSGDPTQAGDPALMYHSSEVGDEPIVQLQLQSPNNAMMPDSVSARLTFDGTTGATVTYSTFTVAGGQTLTLALQAGSAVTTTGLYNYKDLRDPGFLSFVELLSGQIAESTQRWTGDPERAMSSEFCNFNDSEA
jgi:hypothetical protein